MYVLTDRIGKRSIYHMVSSSNLGVPLFSKSDSLLIFPQHFQTRQWFEGMTPMSLQKAIWVTLTGQPLFVHTAFLLHFTTSVTRRWGGRGVYHTSWCQGGGGTDIKISIYKIFMQCFRILPSHCFSPTREHERRTMKEKWVEGLLFPKSHEVQLGGTPLPHLEDTCTQQGQEQKRGVESWVTAWGDTSLSDIIALSL